MGRKKKSSFTFVPVAAPKPPTKQDVKEAAERRRQHIEEEKKIDISLKNLGLVRSLVPKDGACLFRAVAEHVYLTQQHHRRVREECVDYLAAHQGDFEPFVCMDDTPYEWYLEHMRKVDSWGGQVELQALSLLYRTNITVYSQAANVYVDNKFEKTVGLYFSHGNHYDCVYPERHLRIAAFCQGLIYQIISKAEGKQMTESSVLNHKYANVALDCWLRGCEEQERQDRNLAASFGKATQEEIIGQRQREKEDYEEALKLSREFTLEDTFPSLSSNGVSIKSPAPPKENQWTQKKDWSHVFNDSLVPIAFGTGVQMPHDPSNPVRILLNHAASNSQPQSQPTETKSSKKIDIPKPRWAPNTVLKTNELEKLGILGARIQFGALTFEICRRKRRKQKIRKKKPALKNETLELSQERAASTPEVSAPSPSASPSSSNTSPPSFAGSSSFIASSTIIGAQEIRDAQANHAPVELSADYNRNSSSSSTLIGAQEISNLQAYHVPVDRIEHFNQNSSSSSTLIGVQEIPDPQAYHVPVELSEHYNHVQNISYMPYILHAHPQHPPHHPHQYYTYPYVVYPPPQYYHPAVLPHPASPYTAHSQPILSPYASES